MGGKAEKSRKESKKVEKSPNQWLRNLLLFNWIGNFQCPVGAECLASALQLLLLSFSFSSSASALQIFSCPTGTLPLSTHLAHRQSLAGSRATGSSGEQNGKWSQVVPVRHCVKRPAHTRLHSGPVLRCASGKRLPAADWHA